MKIFVTGCCGLIGSNLSHMLIDSGFEVIGVDNLSRGKIENISKIITKDNFTFFEEDIKFSKEWFKKITKDDVVIHLADVVAGISYVFNNEWSIFNENIEINSALAKIIYQYKPYKLIYAGTACSYPQSLQRSIEDSGLNENLKLPADPESGYGWSKLIGDIEYGLLCKNIPTEYINLDLHNVYGTPTDLNLETAQVIPSLAIKAINNEILEVWGNGEQGRAFLHVNDVCDAFVLAISSNVQGTIMIGPNKCTTVREIAEALIESKKTLSGNISYDITKPVGDLGRFYDGNLAKDLLNWEPKVSLESGLEELIDYIKDNL